ncbi:uncharacterized protein BX664DRAFT_261916 [Halteromyces radiatus]|uniref:uncharacterized protein n=1 Tax=Halteromyces radiatus TaxID=101107 RepID=UPI00221E89E2|nr:uncharacterized protein BX664DRAFT_261916 [Halteromyces radiatus]KAI8089831.1 hypothetical protein BX664DRAFT_261916 [Halteromyces radiatus]
MDKNRQKSENRQSQQEKRQLGQKDQQKKSSTTEEYVHPDDKVKPGRRPRYLPYMAPDLIAKGIENNTLYQGILRINKRNRSDGYVTSDDLEHDIYIHGVRDRNRALEGDMVAIRLLDVETIWKHKKEKDQQKKKNTEDLKEQSSVAIEIGTDDEEEQEEEEMDKNKPKFCGQVVGIVHRMEGQQITGTLHIDHHQGPTIDNSEKEEDDDEDNDTTPPVPANNNHVRLLWFKPTDKRAPFIAIPVAQAPDDFLANPSKFDNEIFSAKITRWPIDSRYPFGKLICELGRLGEMVVEAKSILANNNILDADFSTKALKALPKTPWSIPEKEYKTRRDLRSTRIFTIDPETAKDLDDALHITRLEGDQYEVGVHIADVSYFLKRNTQLDVEAKERGTSTYLVDRVIPMLPSLLCEQLCSLNPGVERLAFSVIWKMDNTGHILDTWFGRTIIKSCAKLAYDDAQSVIEKKGLPTTAKVVDHSVSSVEQDILDLLKLSQCMRQRRFENGALSMNSIKLAFKLDEDGEPEKVWVYQLKEANRLIEEFMLRANMSVAEKLCQHYPGEAILRRHEHPIERRLDEFVQVAQDLGYYIDGSTSGTLQASFDAIESEDVKYVLRILAIKPMRRAKYFCTGSFDDISKYLHFALNVPMYTHFTSPIRRYADVMVHRQLESILQEKGDCGYSKKMVQAIALQCNRKKDGAKNAQEQSGHLYLSRYLARLPQPIVRTAIVLQVSNDVFDLLVPDYGLESRVYMDAMPLEQFRYDAVDNSLTVYWKKDGVMNMDTINSIREANQAANNNTSNELNDDKNSNRIDHSQQQQHNGLTFCRTDGSKRMQVFKTFGRFDVLIQVNDERTPPIINIYPINPFFETIE